MPVGIPLVASPAAVLLAIGAAADRGLGLLAVALIITIGALAVDRGDPPRGGRRTHRCAVGGAPRRARSAAVACVLLVVDGVFDV